MLGTIARLAGSYVVQNIFRKDNWKTLGAYVAEWAGASVVDKIVSAGYEYLLREGQLPDDCKAQLKRLKTALPQITAVLGIVEALKMKDPSVGLWVEQFGLALEASEDVLDELEYRMLEDMVENRDEASGSDSSSKESTLERLKEAITMLDQAVDGVERLLQAATVLGVRDFSISRKEVLRYETTSFLDESGVIGRHDEKDKIIRWLKGDCNNVESGLSSFGIVGLGGLGKTTLAQFAYQEMHKLKNSCKTIWVYVSTNFNVEDITKKMLGELDENSCCSKPLNALQEILKKGIDKKEVLLVLDDVWGNERRDWEQLIAPLRSAKWCKILFTTRMKSVADLLVSVISKEHESITLQSLQEQELQKLFNSYAFYGFNPDNHRDMLGIGNQIVKMLLGSPLAAKVIGSLLNSHMDPHYWRRILNHGSIFNLEQVKDVVEVLKLSYYHLPANLQVCFRFCSIFPQGHKFDKNDLIKMWIASGFIRQQLHQEERLEDIGEDYFNHLLRKSFFEYSISWEGGKYVMHDLMHELARNVSTGECCRVESTESPVTIPNTIRHVSVRESEIYRVSHLENLRSLIIFTGINMSSFVLPNNLIMKHLRLLKIEGHRISTLPREISCLVHLRYLSIGQIYVVRPFKYSILASVFKLYHLQVLQFSIAGDNSRVETTGITNLLRLRHMMLPEDTIGSICGIQQLTSLQELTFFVKQKIGHRIDELGALNNLRHLSIKRIENIRDPAEAKNANLLEKNNLMSLSLIWTSKSNPHNHEEIIDYLQPHPNLMELTVQNYEGQKSPNWMKDSPPLKLSNLKLYSCPKWKNQLFPWQMPYLKILDIYDCVNLDKLPDMPLSLIEFRIHNVGLTSLPNLYQSSNSDPPAPLPLKSSLRVVHIERCPKLKSLNGFLQQCNLDLQAIEKLTINSCLRLVHLPTHGFRNLTSLMYLSLRNCRNLEEIDFQGSLLPEKVQLLEMGNCGEFDVPLLEASSALTTLTELHILKYANITSITATSQNSFRSLKRLKITDCPSPTKLPRLLPLSLTTLLINNVQASTLPQYYQSSALSDGPSTSSLISSLRGVEIRNCPKLTELNGFLRQDSINFESIEKIEVINCMNLEHLPEGAFEKFVSLMELIIMDCPMLVAVGNLSNLLPTKLKKLSIANCGKLDVPLLKSASCLDTLTYLSINNCGNISDIPSENTFRSLIELCICECQKLIEQAQDANQGSSLLSLNLSYLEIDHLSLLLIEPLRSLRSVNYLTVGCCSGMESLPEQWLLNNSCHLRRLTIQNASTLKSLPATMARLTVLEELQISHAGLLQHLPELPASLTRNEIYKRNRFCAGLKL